MKHMPLLFIFSLMILASACTQDSSNSGSSSNAYACYGYNNSYTPGCSGYTGTTTGGVTGGSTYCQLYPTDPYCGGATTGTVTGGYGTNPYPNYYSAYVPKNWAVEYPYIPSLNCTEATAPSGISYTPYETRKGSITLSGKNNYDPASGQQYFDTTSEMLQSVTQARNFFWGDSTLKIRFKANLQPYSPKSTNVCPGRATGQSSLHGYGRIKFDAYLVGRRADGTTSTVSLGNQVVDVNSCTSAIDLSSYASQFPNGIYLKISNVYGNQNWWDNDQILDTYGYIYPQNPYVQSTWKLIRDAECWSVDIEVAADGTKTF